MNFMGKSVLIGLDNHQGVRGVFQVFLQFFEEAFQAFGGVGDEAVQVHSHFFAVLVHGSPFDGGVFAGGGVEDLVGAHMAGAAEFISADLPMVVTQFLGDDLLNGGLRIIVKVNGRQLARGSVQLKRVSRVQEFDALVSAHLCEGGKCQHKGQQDNSNLFHAPVPSNYRATDFIKYSPDRRFGFPGTGQCCGRRGGCPWGWGRRR